MKLNRRILIAASLAVGAICALAFPAIAGCPDNDPTCKLQPPESREVRVSTSDGDLVLSELDGSNPLAPLPMPPPALLKPVSAVVDSGSLTPEFSTIALPLRYQDPLDVSCGVQALGMALEGIAGSAPTSNAILGFLQDQGMMYDFGTGVEELAHAAQNFGYTGSLPFHGWSLDQLSAALAGGKPVVVALGANGEDQPGHFVTVTGVSPDGKWVSYNDPTLGKQVISAEEFERLWALQGTSGVSVAEAPPIPLSPNFAPWTALAAAMMATLTLAPSVLQDQWRLGTGGRLIPESGAGGSAIRIGLEPPYQAPAGMRWVKGKSVYETHTRTEIVYHQVPKKELQKVQIGTSIGKFPYTKRILVNNGSWVTDYKTERYVKSYRSKKILDGYKTKRFVKYYRTKLYRNRWGGYSRRRTPVYGYRRVPVYRTIQVPIYSTRKVPNGKHWESKWEYEQHTVYKTVKKPIYKEQLVTVGYERIPEEKIIEEQVLVGYRWALVPEPNHLKKPESDIVDEMGDVRVPMPHPKLLVTTAPLRIRSSQDPGSASLTVALDGAEIIWTGDKKVLKNGAIWYQVRYQDPNKGLVTGWVNSGYLETPVHIPNISTEEKSSIDTSRTAAMRLWLHYFSAEDRAAYIAAEKQRLKAFWSEIRKLTIRQGGLERGVIEGIFINEEVDSLLKPPQWYINGGMPDSFYKEHLLDEETLRALQFILFNPKRLSAEVTDRTWDILSDALHLGEADLKTHIFGNAYWPAENTTSMGSFPIKLRVIRKHGHYLLADPSPGSGNVTEDFLGVPHGEKVTWDGTYKLGVDSDGYKVVYYKVSWVFGTKTYLGWIPSKYLSPDYESLKLDNTCSGIFGYGGGSEAWSKYYSGTGAAQNLDLTKLMKDLGFEDYDTYANPHKNLCGWLAAMEAMGIPLEEGFRVLANLYPDMLKNSDTQANASRLVNFIKEFSTEEWSGGLGYEQGSLERSLSQGNRVIALVAIDSNNGLSSGEENAVNGHWIRIQKIHDGKVWYYDSLTNAYLENPVSIEEFLAAWNCAQYVSGNSTGAANLFVEASR